MGRRALGNVKIIVLLHPPHRGEAVPLYKREARALAAAALRGAGFWSWPRTRTIAALGVGELDDRLTSVLI